ncbi:subclass B1 metallo-beta-lactamase [Pseudoalteromonas sp. SSM20]|uniref:subclass B1 metallo-beta-lactamase n=1 Tax=Pseudoalteromonas sp. SSM20 TaxID=3139394 RepID=UPI003BACDFBF
MKHIFYSLLALPMLASAAQFELTVTAIDENIYQHVSYEQVGKWGMVGASGLVVVDGKDAFFIDTPWSNSDTEKLVDWTQEQGFTLKAAVVTHFHQDASGGLDALNKRNIPTYAYKKTNQLLEKHKGLSATHIIEENKFSLLKDKIEVFYPGGGHTADNVVVWLEKPQMLFGGCFVKGLNSKNLGNLEDAVVSKWPTSIENTLKQFPNIKLVVPGHGKAGNKELLTHTLHLAEKALSKER